MQRILIALLIVIAPAFAIAKPKVAIAPFEGDTKNEYADAVADLLDGTVKVTSVADTKKAMGKLDLSGELETGDARKLAQKLGVDAIVQGSISKKGTKKTLTLKTFNGGKSSSKKITVKSAASLKKEKDDVLAAVENVEEQKDEEAEKEKEREKKEREKNDREKREKDKEKDDTETAEREKKKRDRDKDKDKDDDDKEKKKKRIADGDKDNDDGEGKIRKHKGDDEKGRVLGPGFRVDAGGSFGIRRLTYDSTSPTPPPTTGTFAPGAHVELELFPFAFDGKTGGAAGLGIVGDFDRELGTSITIPKSTTPVSITQQHYSIGARYRLAVGASSALGFGLAYTRRQFVANRTGLNGATLDTPDVDNQAIAPDVWFSAPVSPKATFIADLRGLLLLSSGAITTRMNYGAATAYGVEVKAGVDIPVGGSFALRFAAEISQVSYSFKGGMQNANQRGVTGATDRTIGLNATLGMTY